MSVIDGETTASQYDSDVEYPRYQNVIPAKSKANFIATVNPENAASIMDGLDAAITQFARDTTDRFNERLKAATNADQRYLDWRLEKKLRAGDPRYTHLAKLHLEGDFLTVSYTIYIFDPPRNAWWNEIIPVDERSTTWTGRIPLAKASGAWGEWGEQYAKYEGPNRDALHVGVNWLYFRNALDSLRSSRTVTLYFIDPINPILILPDDARIQHVIMPMRI